MIFSGVSRCSMTKRKGGPKKGQPASQLPVDEVGEASSASHKRKSSVQLQSDSQKPRVLSPKKPDLNASIEASAEEGSPTRRSTRSSAGFRTTGNAAVAVTTKPKTSDVPWYEKKLYPRPRPGELDYDMPVDGYYLEDAIERSKALALAKKDETQREASQLGKDLVDNLSQQLDESQLDFDESPVIYQSQMKAWHRYAVEHGLPLPPSLPSSLLNTPVHQPDTFTSSLHDSAPNDTPIQPRQPLPGIRTPRATPQASEPRASTARPAPRNEIITEASPVPGVEDLPPPPVIEFELQWRVLFDKEQVFKDTDTMQINGDIDNMKSLYSFNRKAKELAERKAKEKGLACHLLTILATVISSKIAVKSRSETDMTNEKTWLKLERRLIPRKDDKELGVILEHCYSPYEGGIVPPAIQAEQMRLAAQAEAATPKGKKKGSTSAGTVTTQLNREADVREDVRSDFDRNLDALLKMWRCKKGNCKNYDRHCWINPDTTRHIPVTTVEFTAWQKAIDSPDGIASMEKPSKTVRELLLKKEVAKKKAKKLKEKDSERINEASGSGISRAIELKLLQQINKENKALEAKERARKRRKFKAANPEASTPESLRSSSPEYGPRPQASAKVLKTSKASKFKPDPTRSSPVRYEKTDDEVIDYITWMISLYPSRKEDFTKASDFFIERGLTLDQIYGFSKVKNQLRQWQDIGLGKPGIGVLLAADVKDFKRYQREQAQRLADCRRERERASREETEGPVDDFDQQNDEAEEERSTQDLTDDDSSSSSSD